MKKIILFSIICVCLVSACSRKSTVITIPANDGSSYGDPVTLPEPFPGRRIMPVPKDSQPRNMLPKPTAFKMSGDYSDNVAVTLDQQGNLTYFPAPTDITDASVPTPLGDGWYLNRQGLNANSVFTKWTFSEYRNLPSVPTPAEIKAAIIPGARVTDFKTLEN